MASILRGRQLERAVAALQQRARHAGRPSAVAEWPPSTCKADSTAVVSLVGLGLAGGAVLWWTNLLNKGPEAPFDAEKSVPLTNWSGTHTVVTTRLFAPESRQQLQEILSWANNHRQKVRPLGTGLSPNGLALESRGMLSMVHLDSILAVDTGARTITVEGGARVSQILEELGKHGLTLENFSSITEQQIGGWTQVAAHGTGARIPTVDEMVTRMTLVTPGRGSLELSADGQNRELFQWARVGLGTLGVVADVTLKCIPRFSLHERTYCSSVAEVRKHHAELLRTYRHVRYMWIPYTDTVVVVVSNVAEPGAKAKEAPPENERVKPLVDLLRRLQPNCGNVEGENFAQLRERLLVMDPLNPEHVAMVNRAEAEFWLLSQGERIADSTQILGFECGGTQWVLENCFPCGTLSTPSLADIDYLVELKETIERERIAAASPIEQRWTARSVSPMSPAYSANKDDIFSWVGVIMYITDEKNAAAIKQRFREYAILHADQTFRYNGVLHWGKVDLDFHVGRSRLADLQANMRRRFDVDGFLRVRRDLDPQNVLGNRLTDTALQA